MEAQLNRFFGFHSFKRGQSEVITKIMSKQSAAAIFPTGAGKSLCYQLPALLLPHLTLVVSPLLALMKDQLEFLLSHNLAAARLDSTLERDEYNAILEKARNGKLKILMVSVERFKNERFRSHLERMNISLLVIDEAHCISEWGHNFRPEYLKLPAYRDEFAIKQVLLLTATATEQVISDMCEKFALPRNNVVKTGFYRKNLFLQVTPTRESEKDDQLIHRVRQAPQDSTIVYVTLQKTAEHVANILKDKGIRAHHYHAGMKNDEREEVQNRFMNGELDCIAATIAFGMGIDKENIRRIIHYDLPKSIESYSQEIGRAGRDGKTSLCEILANRDRVHILENFIYGDTPDRESISLLLEQLKKQDSFTWKLKLNTLSNELNIRLLPLKTLLVYLDLHGIIAPKYTYFEEYSFKYIEDPLRVISSFQGERQQFVQTIVDYCSTQKTWTHVDVSGILNSYNTDRKRVITALEYFEERGWIELQAKQAIDVFDIKNQAFSFVDLARKLADQFKNKETFEIKRIHTMLEFFESNSCLSRNLAEYFGESLDFENCNHCSCCKDGPIKIETTITLEPISSYDFDELTNDYSKIAGKTGTPSNLTKFLCGINTPVFTKQKTRKNPHFGTLENYPFAEVKQWVQKHL